MKKIILLVTHVLTLLLGVALGIYLLPILTEPDAPAAQMVARQAELAKYEATFQRDLEDSDFLHWGEGDVFINDHQVAFVGELAPGPDYRLYFSPDWVDTEAEFLRLKSTMREAGDVKTFDSFLVTLPNDLDPGNYNTIVVWCESFSQFITAAKYR